MKQALNWHYVMAINDNESTVRVFAFGPALRFERTRKLKDPGENWYIFRDKRYKRESALIAAIDRVAK